jgi:chloramphenicol 3-O phosphotransferase
MTATCIVLNGTSCSGKSSIAAALQELWPRPLQVTGIDTFLGSQSQRFFATGGRVAAGFSQVPVTVDGQPAFEWVPGPLGLGMIKASHAYWAACAGAGLDQVIDDVWLVPDQPAGLRDALPPANTLWVGVHCPVAVAEQRERERGDRIVGTVRGQHAKVHTFRKYDVDVDTSAATPQECARAILAVLDAGSARDDIRGSIGSGSDGRGPEAQEISDADKPQHLPFDRADAAAGVVVIQAR